LKTEKDQAKFKKVVGEAFFKDALDAVNHKKSPDEMRVLAKEIQKKIHHEKISTAIKSGVAGFNLACTIAAPFT